MPDDRFPDPREEEIVYGDRRISRPDASLPDWEVPDTSYRAIPIVWFTGAFITHLVAVTSIVILFAPAGALVTIPLSALSAGLIGAWTWERGMKDAATGWKLATATCLCLIVAFALIASA